MIGLVGGLFNAVFLIIWALSIAMTSSLLNRFDYDFNSDGAFTFSDLQDSVLSLFCSIGYLVVEKFPEMAGQVLYFFELPPNDLWPVIGGIQGVFFGLWALSWYIEMTNE